MSILSLLAAVTTPTLPPSHLAIALAVAGQGQPGCTAYHPDGSTGPCLPRFAIRGGGGVNGQSLGMQITFTRGATTRLTRDEFALLAAHEVAHSYLGHNGSSREAELAADRLGAQLACQAGFDPQAGTGLFRFLRSGSKHPKAEQRRAAVLSVPCPQR
ncbi:hypothetical protein [Novosphingobium sp. TH158]|uniref:hypothetical protein n=1 Tax=Novosphingobium sp. TH158 TaxID=2067455 RepID=UPI000C7E0B10|nr:hypothetical protein [Novosphingobium sp. TH158]PLK26433.1 hypothetical protein C0V78_05710 [Novosphingobium sp. TH158]